MFVMVTLQSGFINSNSLEILKDKPNTPPSLKLLEQRVNPKQAGGGGRFCPLLVFPK